jgi:hypothetical protein
MRDVVGALAHPLLSSIQILFNIVDMEEETPIHNRSQGQHQDAEPANDQDKRQQIIFASSPRSLNRPLHRLVSWLALPTAN